MKLTDNNKNDFLELIIIFSIFLLNSCYLCTGCNMGGRREFPERK